MQVSSQFFYLIAFSVVPLFYLYRIRDDYNDKVSEIKNETLDCINGQITVGRVIDETFPKLATYFYLGITTTILFSVAILLFFAFALATGLVLLEFVPSSFHWHKTLLKATFIVVVSTAITTLSFNSLSPV